MRRFTYFVALFIILAGAMPAFAQTQKQLNWCNGKNNPTPQQMFDGCNAGIKSGRHKGAQLGPFYLNRGRANSDLGNKERAMADYEQGLRLSPKDLAGLLNRSNIYAERGEYEKALADLNRAISINAKFTLGYYNRGTLYQNKKDYQRAVDDFTVVIKNAPKFGPAYNNRSLSYISLKQYDRAIADSTMAISLLPANATNVDRAIPYGTRAVAYGKSLDWERAIADISEAVRLSPTRQYLNGRQASFDLSGQPERSLPDLEELLRRDPKDAPVWATRCIVRARIGQAEQGLADCNRALELDPHLAQGYANRGYAFLKLKQFDRAVADYETALKESGYAEDKPATEDNADYLYQRGIARLRGGDALGGAKDIAAAKAARADIADFYGRYGI